MAEFQEVIKQFDRMCKAHVECINCRLRHGDGYSDVCSIDAFIRNTAEIEQKVMSWAAENPEPVYPTWWEWLVSIGAVTRKVKPDVASELIDTGLLDPIPADIAQKLGIEPKEG